MFKLKRTSQGMLAVLFVLAGLNHFLNPDIYRKMMPSYLPAQQLLVNLSGLGEIGFGAALAVPRLTRWAAWGLIALLVAVFPANINMALNPNLFPKVPAWASWLRLPMQAVLIAFIYWCTQPATRRANPLRSPSS